MNARSNGSARHVHQSYQRQQFPVCRIIVIVCVYCIHSPLGPVKLRARYNWSAATRFRATPLSISHVEKRSFKLKPHCNKTSENAKLGRRQTNGCKLSPFQFCSSGSLLEWCFPFPLLVDLDTKAGLEDDLENQIKSDCLQPLTAPMPLLTWRHAGY